MTVNRYESTCSNCGNPVPAGGGELRRYRGHYAVYHVVCDGDPPRVSERSMADLMSSGTNPGSYDREEWLDSYRTDSPTGLDIVYRVGGEGFVGVLFADRESAEHVAQIRSALSNSKTWGELRARLPKGEWDNHFAPDFEDYEGSYDDPFGWDDAPGAADGDYPMWLLQSMLNWFPKELIEKYGGSLRRTMLNGDALELPADKAEPIAAELRAMGNTVEKTDLNIS